MEAEITKSNNSDEIVVTETRVIRRISLAGVFASVIDVFNLDRGLVYTLKRLYSNPGRAIKDYLGEGRYHYTPPFRLLLVTTTLVVIIMSFSETGTGFFNGASQGLDESSAEAIQRIMLDYYNIFAWLLIPFLAFFTWLFNRQAGLNFAEHLVYQAYLSAITNILFLPMLLDSFMSGTILGSIYLIATLFYYTFAYRQIFKKNWVVSFLLTIVIFTIGLVLWSIMLSFIIGVFLGAIQ